MAQITVTIDAKTYRMACADGEEDHLVGLAAEVDGRIAELRKGFGEIGDQRLTVMAAIMVSDELSEARKRVAELEENLAAATGRQEDASRSAASGREVLAETMNRVSEEIERIALKLERGP